MNMSSVHFIDHNVQCISSSVCWIDVNVRRISKNGVRTAALQAIKLAKLFIVLGTQDSGDLVDVD
jgi:hypothetical protein